MWRAAAWWVTGILLFAAAAELLCRLLPVSTSTETGYYIDANVLSYPPHHRWHVATGWDLRNSQALQANNLGFASGRDFVADPNAVALIGDSYVEASMLDAADRPEVQLEHALGGPRPVYGMGMPGSSLLDYAERIRLARQRLGVRTHVVLMESTDVRQSLCGSGNVHAACLDGHTLVAQERRLPEPGPLKQWLRRSALAQYMVGQLKLDPAAWLAQFAVRSDPPSKAALPAPGPDERMVRAVVGRFLERVTPHIEGGRLVVLVDGARPHRDPLVPVAAAERRILMEALAAGGAVVIDAELLYAAHQARSQRSLEVGPYDRHLNGSGIRLLVGAAAAALR